MISPSGLELIKEFEGFRLDAYLCPVNVWTIGYGSTRINGRPVKKGDRLASAQDAHNLLMLQVKNEFLPKLEIIPRWAEMTEFQQGALLSFAWNLGAHFYGSNGFQTITKALQTDWEAVPSALKLYVRGGGKTLPGLVRRRQAESDLWVRGLALIENEGTPIKEDSSVIDYFLDFAMNLDRHAGNLAEGRLVLRSVSRKDGVTKGRTHVVWVCTTSTANKQGVEAFHQKGGPIPPEYRAGIQAWEVNLSPIYMPDNAGVRGNFYKIDPHLVKTDKGGERGDFGIHLDANVPGSLGCPVMSSERFKSFEAEMKRLRELGYKKLPLFVTYSTN